MNSPLRVCRVLVLVLVQVLNPLVLQVLVSRHEKRITKMEEFNTMPLYPTEEVTLLTSLKISTIPKPAPNFYVSCQFNCL